MYYALAHNFYFYQILILLIFLKYFTDNILDNSSFFTSSKTHTHKDKYLPYFTCICKIFLAIDFFALKLDYI